MSVLSRLRGRRHHEQLTSSRAGEHPAACRCEGNGVLRDGADCPLRWVSRPAPDPQWLIGRVPRGSQR